MKKHGAPFGSANAVKHFMYAQPDKLPAEKISRLAELRQMVKTDPGRREIREELTARMALICDLGYAHLAEQHRAGKDIWALDLMKRLQGFVAETRRLLDSFEALPPGLDHEHERIRAILDAEPIREHIRKNGGRENSE